MYPPMSRKVRRFLAETRRSWRKKIRKHLARKPFAASYEQLSHKDKEILRQSNLKPLEEVTETELKRCSRAQLDIYSRIYRISRGSIDVVVEELMLRKNLIELSKQTEETEQPDENVVTSGIEESDVKQVAFLSPFEFFLHFSKKKILGVRTCSDLSSILYLAFELFQTGRAKVISCLLPIYLRRTKTATRKFGFLREITVLSCKALLYRRSYELVRLLSRLFQLDTEEKTVSLNDLGKVPSSIAIYNKRSMLELEQGKVAALNQLVFVRWYLRDYLSAISDISGHLQLFPYANYRVFYVVLASFFCLEAYRELGFDEELTIDIRGDNDHDRNRGLGYVFPFNFLSSWSYLPDFAKDSSAEKSFAVDYFEKALNCLERCTEFEAAPNIFVVLKSIVLAYYRNVEESVVYMEEFIQKKGSFDSYLLENYLRCLEIYQTMLSSTDTSEEKSIVKKRVLTAQHLLLEINPFSGIAINCLSGGLERRLSTFEEILQTVACQLDYLGNMERRFLTEFDFWKSSFRHSWRNFAELLDLCDDSQVESLWQEKQRYMWWPSRFFSYASLKEDYKYYPDVVSYKTFCARRLVGSSSEYEFYQERGSDI